MFPKQKRNQPGQICAMLSLAIAGFALALLAYFAGQDQSLFHKWLSGFATAILIVTGMLFGLVALWRSRCAGMAVRSVVANIIATALAVLWWYWPTPQSFVHAVQRGDVAEARFALWMGIDVESQEIWGWHQGPGHTSLTAAAQNGDLRMVRLLLDAGADVTRADSDGRGNRPLLYAAWSGDVATFQLLLDEGADPLVIDNDGSAIHMAAAMGHLDIVEQMLKVGVPVDLLDRNDQTPLVSAIIARQPDSVQFLLDRGASRFIADGSALRKAAGIGDPQVIDLLIDAGAPINAANSARLSPLLLAVRNGQQAAVRQLLECGADPQIGPVGSKPYDLAVQNLEKQTAVFERHSTQERIEALRPLQEIVRLLRQYNE